MRALEDLDAHGVVEREGEGVGTAFRWRLSDYARELLAEIGGGLPEMSEVSL